METSNGAEGNFSIFFHQRWVTLVATLSITKIFLPVFWNVSAVPLQSLPRMHYCPARFCGLGFLRAHRHCFRGDLIPCWGLNHRGSQVCACGPDFSCELQSWLACSSGKVIWRPTYPLSTAHSDTVTQLPSINAPPLWPVSQSHPHSTSNLFPLTAPSRPEFEVIIDLSSTSSYFPRYTRSLILFPK